MPVRVPRPSSGRRALAIAAGSCAGCRRLDDRLGRRGGEREARRRVHAQGSRPICQQRTDGLIRLAGVGADDADSPPTSARSRCACAAISTRRPRLQVDDRQRAGRRTPSRDLLDRPHLHYAPGRGHAHRGRSFTNDHFAFWPNACDRNLYLDGMTFSSSDSLRRNPPLPGGFVHASGTPAALAQICGARARPRRTSARARLRARHAPAPRGRCRRTGRKAHR